MGSTYVNFTLRGPSQQAVAKALSGRSAFISPSFNGCVVVYDKNSEEQSKEIEPLGAKLSRELGCPVLAVFVYHDDILYYWLFEQGEQTDKYDSNPSHFDEDAQESAPPVGGNAEKLCMAFGVQKSSDVERILRMNSDGNFFEFKRQGALYKTLGLPECAVSTGYGYINRGEMPADLKTEDLVTVT